jgi:hypothetical protein
MKHLLNNMSEEEKNLIREQHSGGMKISINNFSKLVESRLGNVKPLVNEQKSGDKITIAYRKMIDGASGWGTDPKDIIDGINMLTSADEFYQMNDKFKDGKTGYKSFDEMIRNEFEYQRGDDNNKVADSNKEDIKQIIKKLSSWGIKYTLGKSNEYEKFAISPKPVAVAAPAADPNIDKDWDKVKNYLTKNGFPPDFPLAEGKFFSKEENGIQYFYIENDEYGLMFGSKRSVWVFRAKGKDTQKTINRSWTWDGSKPVLDGDYKFDATKNAKGYAKTGDEIAAGTHILGLGSRGDVVKQVQYAIAEYYDFKDNPGNCKKDEGAESCDGIYGKLTKKSVRNFQKDNGFKAVDGNVGRETWARI